MGGREDPRRTFITHRGGSGSIHRMETIKRMLTITFLTVLVAYVAVYAVNVQQADGHVIPRSACYAKAKAARLADPTPSYAEWRAVLVKCLRYKRKHAQAHACNQSVPAIIRCVFGPVGDAAVSVAACESGLNPAARGPRDEYGNPRQGLFQFGTWERRTFGYGPDAWSQSRGALRYFNASGRDWSPWECKP